MTRKRKAQIIKDLTSKIVFLTGPRQVGKTWLAKDIAGEFAHPVYLNYDNRADREIIEKEGWLGSTDLLVLDEIHKMQGWKNYIKGIYDTKPAKLKILVTGSARLEFYRQTGDSLSGRFFTHRLYPFTPGELTSSSIDDEPGGLSEPWPPADALDRLISRGGFPEPLLAEDETFARRWRNQYVDGLIREDVLDLEKFSDFKSLKLCLEMLRSRVGSPISYTSIARDIGIAPNTVKKYIQVFEELYIVFRVTPFSGNIARSLLKEPKIYFFDTALVEGDDGVKFENLAALSLAKEAAADEDIRGIPASLNYLRTKDGQEVDFCFVKDGKPLFFVETKYSDSNISKNLYYFCSRYNIPGVQLVKDLKRERQEANIEVRSAHTWLKEFE
jgi:predicted AAA+ superfamily ATPase